mgnify:CR=1 FL=1
MQAGRADQEENVIRFSSPWALLLLFALSVLLVADRRRWRELVLPGLAAVALVLALAGPEVRHRGSRENVAVLVDRSASVSATSSDADVPNLLDALRGANPDKAFRTVLFSARATALGAPSDSAPRTTDLGLGTDLAAAVDVALAALPPGEANEMVLASDGRITDGRAEAIGAACSAGVPISVLPFGQAVLDDASVRGLDAPERVDVGQPFQIVARVVSGSAGAATLALYRDGELLSSTSVSLPPGLARFRLIDTLSAEGAHTYRALVRRDGDPIRENDSLSVYVATYRPPPLLIVTRDVPAALSAQLAASGRSFVRTPAVPPLEELADYRDVLVTGLPLGTLTPDDIATLRSFVADLGGGLLVAEGEAELRGVRSGGIEDVLPISYTLPQRANEASLAVVYLLDRSASMLGHAEGAAKIDVLKEAAAASVSLLDPAALAGIIAFDREFRWLRALAPVFDGRDVYDSLRTLEASGGTDIFYPTVAALDALEGVSARIKHILLFSDGKTVNEPRDWDGLVARLAAQSDIRLSAVAVGPQPNLDLLGRLTEAGHGTLYAAADYSLLPRVSMEATQRLSESRFVEVDSAVSGELATGALAGIPPVQGYARTYARPTAEILLSADSDPILARWRLGLGRAGVLNTDLDGTWSRDWFAWSRASLLLDAVLGSVEAETRVEQGLRLSAHAGTAGIHVWVEARESDGGYANFLDLEAALSPAGGAAALRQTSAGLYEGQFPPAPEGGYVLRVDDRTRGRTALLPVSVPYADEYRETGVDEDALRSIAAATGGSFLTAEEPALPRTPARAGTSYVPIRRAALLAALGLFLLDLVRRKVPRRLGSRHP